MLAKKLTTHLPVRERNGRLSRAAIPHEAAPAEVRRLRDAALRGMASAEWGTPLGVMFLQGKIDAAQYQAGKTWALLVCGWQAATGCPSPSPKSPSVVFGDRSAPLDFDTEEGRRQMRRDLRTIDDMREAHDVLTRCGRGVARVVRELCEANQAPRDTTELALARTGLSALAALGGLTGNPNRAKRQK